MKRARHSDLMLVTAAALWTAVASGQGVSAPVPAGRAAGPAPTPTKAPQAPAAKTILLPAAPPPANPAGASPVQATSLLPPGLPPFVLSEIYYFEPATGTKYAAADQGTRWLLPVVDTMKAASVTFLFASNVPSKEIAEMSRRRCADRAAVANQSVTVSALTFAGDRVFVRATVPDMQSWPKTVQLHMFHSGGAASPANAGRASSPIGNAAPSGQAQAPVASFKSSSSAPILRPFMDYKSTLATVQPARRELLREVPLPTFCTRAAPTATRWDTRPRSAPSTRPAGSRT